MLSALLIAAASPPCPSDRLRAASLEQTQAAWLDRFNALDLPCFLRFFAADATVFSPGPVDGSTRRVEPAGLSVYWSQIFAGLGRNGNRLSITPQTIAITPLGRRAAVVSFHLSADANPNRRTLVWRREREGWRIVHLHASRVPPPAER
jgi:ketosteroid isomerase-like protein